VDRGGGRRRIEPAALVVIAGFVASRVAFHAAGVRFDASGRSWLWQFLDPAWLRDDLANSLLHLHSQPPVMNAILGVAAKLAGSHAPLVIHGLYDALGLGLALALWAVLQKLGLSSRVAAALALVYAASPTALLYEHWLMYTHLESVLLVGAAWALVRFVEHRGARDAALYGALLATLAITRSLFHIVWLVPCVALALVAARPPRRAAVACCALAFVPVLGLYAKNAWFFGVPAASSSFGSNLANGLLELWPLEERPGLVDAGVSPLVLIPPFSPLELYPESFQTTSPFDVAALREPAKSNEMPNFNAWSYLGISRQYGSDARALIRREPRRYAAMVSRAWQRFWTAPSDYSFVERNRRRIAAWDHLYAALQGVPDAWAGQRGTATDPTSSRTAPGRIAWLWLGLCAGALATAAVAVLRDLRAVARGEPVSRTRLALGGFLLWNTVFVAFAANAVELGENHRFRVAIEPLLLALVAFATRELARSEKLPFGRVRRV